MNTTEKKIIGLLKADSRRSYDDIATLLGISCEEAQRAV